MLTKLDILMLSLLVFLTLASTWMNANYVPRHGNHLVTREVQTDTPAGNDKPAVVPVAKLPDFSSIADVKRKKQAFFSFMLPMVKAQNEVLLVLRNKVKALEAQPELTTEDKKWLTTLAQRYKVNVTDKFDPLFFTRLLDRVDIIPASLALAQSANESAWGTSRFAREGNNLFGQWCFTKGCGLIPGSRPKGASYEVQKFATASDSVRAYMHNLNTHYQYETLRAVRAAQRSKEKAITGPLLVNGLHAYSIRGVDYVDELIGMMATNHLVDYDMGEVTPET